MPQHLQLVRASRRVERRMFLQALALGLSVPIAAKFARTALAAGSPAPKRFMLLYMPHGVPTEHYSPQVSDGDRTNFALDQSNVSVLGPLEKYKSYVNVYEGFNYPGGQTHTGIVNCLSGAPIAADNTTTPRTTVEHAIANSLGVKPLILGACSHLPYGLDSNGMLMWNGTAVDPQKNPVAAADSLFGAAKPTMVNADVELRKDLLALTATEIQGLQSSIGNLTSEKTKLQRHLEAIQGLQNGKAGAASSCTMAPVLPNVEKVRAATAGLPPVTQSNAGDDYFYKEKNFPLLFQAQLELAAQALLCNAAQVVAVMPLYATCDFDFSFSQPGSAAPLGGWSHHNGLSHTNPVQIEGAQYNSPISIKNFKSDTRAAFAKAQLWFANQLEQYIVKVLANADDPTSPGTKVLDNTLIYWMSEIGDGAAHNTKSEISYPQVQTYLPLVTIGKCGGALKTGQVVRNATDRPAADLYLTMAKAMGAATATFPGSPQPVSEVLT